LLFQFETEMWPVSLEASAKFGWSIREEQRVLTRAGETRKSGAVSSVAAENKEGLGGAMRDG
jgi:hypothetical protein